MGCDVGYLGVGDLGSVWIVGGVGLLVWENGEIVRVVVLVVRLVVVFQVVVIFVLVGFVMAVAVASGSVLDKWIGGCVVLVVTVVIVGFGESVRVMVDTIGSTAIKTLATASTERHCRFPDGKYHLGRQGSEEFENCRFIGILLYSIFVLDLRQSKFHKILELRTCKISRVETRLT